MDLNNEDLTMNSTTFVHQIPLVSIILNAFTKSEV